MRITLAELAEAVGGEAFGDPSLLLDGPCAQGEEVPGCFVAAFDQEALDGALKTDVSAIMLPRELPVPSTKAAIVVEDIRLAFLRALERFAPPRPLPGVDPSASVHPSAWLGPEVSVGPFALIEAEARVGARTVIGPYACIGAGVEIGDDCVLHARATVRENVRIGSRCVLYDHVVVGSEGYGYLYRDGRHQHIPQLGTVIVEDEVEIGSGTCVDRGTLGATRIGAGTKIDNLCQIGHNVQIGKQCIIVALVGIAGSSIIGDGVQIGGHSGVTDHVAIGDRARVAAMSGVMTNIQSGTEVSGVPAMPHYEHLKVILAQRQLPALRREVQRLTKLAGKGEPPEPEK